MSASLRMGMVNRVTDAETEETAWRSLYTMAGVAALAALAANVLDVALGLGETEITAYSAKSAVDWFALYQEDGFKGLYLLGILNIVYQACMVPVFLALVVAHRHTAGAYAALAMIVSLLGMAIYVANNAAVPMLVLSSKHASVTTEAQRAVLAAAGEAVLARGEDFTPGAFIGMILSGSAAIGISLVMLRGRIFGKTTAWIGVLGFTFVSIFTLWATFIPVWYEVAYYGFGMIGGLLVLAWFVLVALRLFRLGRTGT